MIGSITFISIMIIIIIIQLMAWLDRSRWKYFISIIIMKYDDDAFSVTVRIIVNWVWDPFLCMSSCKQIGYWDYISAWCNVIMYCMCTLYAPLYRRFYSMLWLHHMIICDDREIVNIDMSLLKLKTVSIHSIVIPFFFQHF